MADSPGMRVAVVSLGCPKALVDSEKMLGLLAEAGCAVGAPPEEADVILVNTCAFIAPACRESLAAIRQALAWKRRGPGRRVVVAGCLPQRYRQRLLAELPGIDAIIGVFNRQDVVAAVTGGAGPMVRPDTAGASQLGATGAWRPGGPCGDDRGRLRLTPRHTAYLRLSEGCSWRCSYCTIPGIRGPMRSKPPGAVLAEAAELVADGAVELNLIAQDTAAYGADLAGGRGGRSANLPGLLRRLDRLGGLRWVRLMYAHPASVTPAVIDALADCRSAVKYLDLPLQHVNDRLLARMRRGYDRRGVEALLARLRRAMPGIALRTTFIVGLPGEGRREFDELLGFVRDQRFDAVGVLPYWPEEGTPAARMAGQVPARTRRRRLERLMVAQQEIAFAANAARVGRRLAVLVDGADARGRCVGRHAGQAPDVDGLCRLARPAPAGRIVQAVVTGYDAYDLVARPL